MGKIDKSQSGRESDGGGVSRRDAIKGILGGLFGGYIALNTVACGEDSAEEPESYIYDVEKYKNILETYPNLQKIRDALTANKYWFSEGSPKTGFEIVMGMLGNHFNPENSDFTTIKHEVSEYLDNMTGVRDKIFLMRTVQALWTEANKGVSWSLKDYSDEEIDALFHVARFEDGPQLDVPFEEYFYESSRMPQAEIDAAYQFHFLAQKLLGESREETIYNVIRWLKANIFHAYISEADNEVWGWDEMYGGEIPEDLSAFMQERGGGCHTACIAFANILKALNIPVVNIRDYGGHAISYVPEMDKFIHGDMLVKTAPVPDEMYLWGYEEVNSPDDHHVLRANFKEKIKEHYGDQLSDEDVDSLMMLSIRRSEDDLIIRYHKPLSDELLQIIQEEAPQYNVRLTEDGTGVESDHLPIKSLAELSEPDVDIWK